MRYLYLLGLLLLAGCQQYDAVVLSEYNDNGECYIRVMKLDTRRVVVVSRYCGYQAGDTIRTELP